ncbi:MAG: RHS repeat-associated core domain-containing protein [Clostridia bacterium]|nr:RHS repeat-associated core domain-containing protein [Clostridia bacterium]
MTTYGNGDTIGYRYNKLGLVDQTVRTDGDNVRTFNWAYSSAGVLLNHTDSVNNRRFNYDYDSLGRLVRQEIRTQDNSSHIGFVEQGYDLRNNINKLILTIGSTTVKQNYSYSAYSKNDADGNAIANSSASYAKDNLPTLYEIESGAYATYTYDSINRLNKRTLSTDRPIYNNYVYCLSNRNATSTYDTVDLYRTHQLLREIVDNTAYDYTYDVSGNITAITKAQRAETNTDAIGITGSAEYRSYAYDNLNQLIRENNASNNKTTTFSYDELGNITSKTEYAYTTGNLGTVNKTILYGYSNDGKQGWNNLLTSVDLNGDGVITANEQITYDEIGNPTSYLGNSLAWDGRQLTSYNGISYSYDADGIRASKTVGNTKTEYYYVGDVIHYQVSTNITTGEKVNELYFLYDSYGHLTSIRLVTSEFTHAYYVTTNMQGDVLGIYTAGGDLITSYDYDAWGNCTATNYLPEYSLIGEINPIRYRGYYYDVETGLYYLNSRYYDSNTGRFLNADNQLSTGDMTGMNLFAYCGNNPVVRADSTGLHWYYLWIDDFFNWLNSDSDTKDYKNTAHEISYSGDPPKKDTPRTYTDDDVNVFLSGEGSKVPGKINVKLMPDHTKNGKPNPNIRIYDSYKIVNKKEREQILDIIISNSKFNSTVFRRGKSSWMSEWNGHNDLYLFLSWTPLESNLRTVDLDENDPIPWEWYPQ